MAGKAHEPRDTKENRAEKKFNEKDFLLLNVKDIETCYNILKSLNTIQLTLKRK